MTDYVKTLNTVADSLELKGANEWVESAALREVAIYITKLERALDIYSAERERFKHTKPEMTGAFFISGEAGTKDRNMLPERILICPAYGCDWSQIYVRTEQTTGPEY